MKSRLEQKRGGFSPPPYYFQMSDFRYQTSDFRLQKISSLKIRPFRPLYIYLSHILRIVPLYLILFPYTRPLSPPIPFSPRRPASSEARSRLNTFSSGPILIRCFDGQIDSAFLVNFFNNDRYDISFFESVGDSINTKRRDFRDMHKTFGAWTNTDKRSEIHEPSNFTLKLFARLVFSSHAVNNFFSRESRAGLSGDEHCAIVFYINLRAGLLHNTVYGFASCADNKADLIRFDFCNHYLWRVRAQIWPGSGNCFLNLIQNSQAG